MQLHAIALRALFAFFFLLIMVRLSGKRTVYQGTPMDFVVALIMGDMIDDLLWAEVSASQFTVGVGMLFIVHVATSMGVFANPALARLIEGVPIAVLHNATLDEAGMRRERINDLEVMEQLRQHSIEDVRQVQSATAEISGQVSVLQHEWAREAQCQDLEKIKELKERRSRS
jgi:uncharacterized membrane protein YcaP (DUF421 family)